jgi:hypothetical protein
MRHAVFTADLPGLSFSVYLHRIKTLSQQIQQCGRHGTVTDASLTLEAGSPFEFSNPLTYRLANGSWRRAGNNPVIFLTRPDFHDADAQPGLSRRFNPGANHDHTGCGIVHLPDSRARPSPHRYCVCCSLR